MSDNIVSETQQLSLNEKDDDQKKPAPAGEEAKVDPSSVGWTKPIGYDYQAYSSKGKDVETIASVPLWASDAAKYEWQDDFGDVGPRVPELEDQLFNHDHVLRRGDAFAKLELQVTQESEVQIKPIREFADAALHPIMLENIQLCQYDHPTPIQGYCIPAILEGRDIIAVAQTGSGKTASFLIPILSKLMGKAKKLAAPRPSPIAHFDPRVNGVVAEPLVLVVVPTRELAVQIFDEARRLCYRSMLRPCVAYGGAPTGMQLDELRRGCDILIGTPGRLIDFMGRGNVLSLRRIRYTVIDEADELVGNDWDEDMERLLSGGDMNEDADHRYMLFSATFPKQARELADKYLDGSHVRITVGRLGSTHKNITQIVLDVDEDKKRECLRDLLLSLKPTRTMIFVNSKRAADFLDDYLFNCGFPSTSIHAGRTQREREDAIRAFRTSKAPILVTTGVSARGIDVSNVMHVINFDLPAMDHGGITEYKHRIGRTARMGNKGLATSFFNERDEALGPLLVQCLIDNDQNVPDFLQGFKPADGERYEEDQFGDESNNDAGTASGGWGAGNNNDDELPSEVIAEGTGQVAPDVQDSTKQDVATTEWVAPAENPETAASNKLAEDLVW